MKDLRALAEAMGCPEDGFWRQAALCGGLLARAAAPSWRPPLAVRVGPRALTVVVRLEGISRRGLRLSVAGRTLAVFGEPLRGGVRMNSGRPLGGYRTVARLVRLPVRAGSEGARAVLSGSTLTVRLARAPARRRGRP